MCYLCWRIRSREINHAKGSENNSPKISRTKIIWIFRVWVTITTWRKRFLTFTVLTGVACRTKAVGVISCLIAFATFIKNKILSSMRCYRKSSLLNLATMIYLYVRVTMKIFEDFFEDSAVMFCKKRSGTCINRPLHKAWIQYQAAHPKLTSHTTSCKLACHLAQK